MLYGKKIFPYYPYIVTKFTREKKKEKLPPADTELMKRLTQKGKKADKKRQNSVNVQKNSELDKYLSQDAKNLNKNRYLSQSMFNRNKGSYLNAKK